jgi:hypothetical protein
LGEFGATVMVLGDVEGRQTLPIAIYNDYLAGDLAHALARRRRADRDLAGGDRVLQPFDPRRRE